MRTRGNSSLQQAVTADFTPEVLITPFLSSEESKRTKAERRRRSDGREDLLEHWSSRTRVLQDQSSPEPESSRTRVLLNQSFSGSIHPPSTLLRFSLRFSACGAVINEGLRGRRKDTCVCESVILRGLNGRDGSPWRRTDRETE